MLGWRYLRSIKTMQKIGLCLTIALSRLLVFITMVQLSFHPSVQKAGIVFFIAVSANNYLAASCLLWGQK